MVRCFRTAWALVEHRTIKIIMVILLLLILFFCPTAVTNAHPGSGIVVDRFGNIYFVDTGSGIWKIDTKGNLSRLAGNAFHWLALDQQNKLTNVSLPAFVRGGAVVNRIENNPPLIISSDFPIATSTDGSLFFPWIDKEGILAMYRLAPSGTTVALAELPPDSKGKPLQWLNGIAAAPDGSVYYTENSAVRKVTPQGRILTIAQDVHPAACKPFPWAEHLGAYLRGIDVDSNGNVYVAASGCRSVLRIAQDGSISTVLTSEGLWSPTAVAVFGRDILVLEYRHTDGDDRQEWVPRVRRLLKDGSVTTLTTITRK